MISRRLLLPALALPLFATAARAQNFPGGQVRIIVKAAVHPDYELSGQSLWGRCGELHHVRLPGGHDHVRCPGASAEFGANRFGLRP